MPAERSLSIFLRQARVSKASMPQASPSATLSWLAGEARRQASLHGKVEGFDEGVIAFWSERAAATARLLDELASVEVGMNNGETDHG